MAIKINFAQQQNAPINTVTGNPASAARVGRAVSGFGKSIQGVSSVIEQKLIQDAAAIEADLFTSVQEETNRDYRDAQASTRSNLSSASEENKINNLELQVGLAGPDGDENLGFTDYVLANYDKRVQEKLSNVTNGFARRNLDKKFKSLRQQVVAQSLQYEAAETRKIRMDLIGQSAERMGRLVYDNPAAFMDNAEELLGLIDQSGIGAANIVEQKDRAMNSLAFSAMEGLIRLDPQVALNNLDSADSSLKNNLKPNQLVALRSKAEAAQGRLQDKTRLEFKQVSESNKESILSTGVPVPEYEQLANQIYSGDKDKLKAALDQQSIWTELYVHKSSIESMPFNQVPEYLDTLSKSVKPGTKDFAVKQQALIAASRVAEEQQKLRRKDMALLVEQTNPEIFEDIPPENVYQRAKMRADIALQRGANQFEVRYLTNSEREAQITTLQQANVNQILDTVNAMRAQYDAGEVPLFREVAFEILSKENGLDPLYSQILYHAANDSLVAGDLVKAVKLRSELNEFTEDKPEFKNLSEFTNREISEWMESTLMDDPDQLGLVNDVTNASVYLSKMYMVQDGLKAKDAVRKATKKLVHDQLQGIEGAIQFPNFVFNGHQKIPVNMDRVNFSLGQLKKSIVKGVPLISRERTFGGNTAALSEEHVNEIMEIGLSQSYWKNSENGKGVILMVPFATGALPARKKDGSPYYVSFEEAQNMDFLLPSGGGAAPNDLGGFL